MVDPVSGCGLASMRSGQSAALMSQKRHSWGLGTRLGGVSAAMRRMVEPSCSMNWPGRAPRGTRLMWSR